MTRDERDALTRQLKEAIKSEDIAMIKECLDNGAQIGVMLDNVYFDAVDKAVLTNNVKLAKVVINKGQCCLCNNVPHFLNDSRYVEADMRDFILSEYEKHNKLYALCEEANFQRSFYPQYSQILSHETDKSFIFDIDKKYAGNRYKPGDSCYQYSAENGASLLDTYTKRLDLDSMVYLMSLGAKIDVDFCNKEGLLQKAAEADQEFFKAEVSAFGGRKQTPFLPYIHSDEMYGQDYIEIMHILIRAGVDKSILSEADNDGHTVVQDIISSVNENMIDLLFDECIEFTVDDLLVALNSECTSLAGRIIERGIEPRSILPETELLKTLNIGNEAIDEAIAKMGVSAENVLTTMDYSPDKQLVEKFMKFGFDIDSTNPEGKTILEVAFDESWSDLMKDYIDLGASLTKDNVGIKLLKSMIKDWEFEGDSSVIEVIAGKVDITGQEIDGVDLRTYCHDRAPWFAGYLEDGLKEQQGDNYQPYVEVEQRFVRVLQKKLDHKLGDAPING